MLVSDVSGKMIKKCSGVCGGVVQPADQLDEGHVGQKAVAALVQKTLKTFLKHI